LETSEVFSREEISLKWSQTSEVLETSEVFSREKISLKWSQTSEVFSQAKPKMESKPQRFFRVKRFLLINEL
jgi:hypothetical protein